MRILLSVLSAAIAATIMLSPSADAATIQPTNLLWGATVVGSTYGYGNPPADMRSIDAFERNAGKKVAMIPFGNSWSQVAGKYNPFPVDGMNAVQAHGSLPFYTWLSKGPDDYRNTTITSGKYDAYITQWATDAKNWGHPFFLRFDHEMNGSWYAWGEGKDCAVCTAPNPAGTYIPMWRHVHDIFTRVGATNVTWVFSVNFQCTEQNCPGRYPPLWQVYPGDNYVDWTAVDPYNQYPDAWISFTESLQGDSKHADMYHMLYNVAPGKPLMVSEFATTESPADPLRKPRWLTEALTVEIPWHMPQIKAIMYYDNGQDNAGLPIETSALSTAAFRAAIAKPYYATNTFGNASGKITALP